MTVNYNISEDIPYDLSLPTTESTFALTDIAYDVVIDDLPFIVSVNNQNPYRRETAPYKKEQFDNSQEPGEQSLTGWWLRSQTSWHNGTGVTFYEPGTDYEHVSHRFADSRGIDVWTFGEATLLPEVFHAYTGANGINAATGKNGTTDCLISGDTAGVLKRLVLNNDSAMVTTNNYSEAGATTTLVGHSTTFPILSVATTGTRYFAACSEAIHTGTISNLDSDVVFARHDSSSTAMIKYAKGYLFFGDGRTLNLLNTAYTGNGNHTGASDIAAARLSSESKDHVNPDWNWKDVTAGPTFVYAAGSAGNKSEIYAIPFDKETSLPDMSGAFVVTALPDGETIVAIEYYLGYLALGTTRGVRICQVDINGLVVLGPLLIDSVNAVNGFATKDKFIYAATKAKDGAYDNACLIRIDLSQSFEDGSFAYAYDLEYRSSLDADNSEATEVYLLDNRLVMVVEEDSTAGELQVQHSTSKRNTGWIKTGKIRYGTIEPKFFRYINLQCTTGQGDSIQVYTIDKLGAESSLAIVSGGLSNKDILITNPSTKQEFMAFKFVFNNSTDDQDLPVLEAYQIKATPAGRRQRLYQYPLSCYDKEMDRYNSIFGYDGRAMEFVQSIEAIEETGKFVYVTDYRTNEQFEGVIEEVRFTNESSPDKDSSGFGGVLLVTVRKL